MKFIYEENRIYVKNDEGKLIVLATFPFVAEKVINVDHTFVDPSLRGQGIASILMGEVYNFAKQKGYTIVNSCPYAIAWFKKNLDKNDILNNEIKVAEVCKI